MKIASIQIGYGTEVKDKISLNIYLSGCHDNKLCDRSKCHNPDLQKFNFGENYLDWQERIESILYDSDLIDCICLLGGEPFDQNRFALQDLIERIVVAQVDNIVLYPIYVYTGYTQQQLLDHKRDYIFLDFITNIYCGEFKEGKETKKWFYENDKIQ